MKTNMTYSEGECNISGLRTGDILINFCNCRCEWKAPWQQVLKRTCQNAYIADLNTRKGDASKLGMVTWSKERNGIYVVNLYCYIEHINESLISTEEHIYRALKIIALMFPNGRLIVPVYASCLHPRWRTGLEMQLHDVMSGREIHLYEDGK